MLINPFVPGSGAQPAELLGRDAQLRHVDTMLARAKNGMYARPMVFHGLRGVGKTVLLNECMDRAVREGFVTVKTEASGDFEQDISHVQDRLAQAPYLTRVEQLRDTLIEAFTSVDKVSASFASLSISMEKRESRSGEQRSQLAMTETRLRTVATHLAAKGSGLVLLVDEAQLLPEMLMRMLLTLQHECVQERIPFFLIMAGLPNLPGKLTEARTYAERLFLYMELGYLDEQTTRQTFSDTVSAEGKQFASDALEEISAKSQGYPYFIQAYGAAAWDRATGSVITLHDVEASMDEAVAELDGGLYLARWQHVSPRARLLMSAMAQCPEATTGKLADMLSMATKQLSKAREELIRQGVAYAPERERLAFAVPGMADFIRRTDPTFAYPKE